MTSSPDRCGHSVHCKGRTLGGCQPVALRSIDGWTNDSH